MTTISFVVPGSPVPKARPRFRSNKKTGARQTYTPARTTAYEKKVRALALVARQKMQQRVWKGPVGLDVTFFVGNPAGKPDLDNLIKAIKDACNGIIYTDDAQITHLWARKKECARKDGADMGAVVTFCEPAERGGRDHEPPREKWNFLWRGGARDTQLVDSGRD